MSDNAGDGVDRATELRNSALAWLEHEEQEWRRIKSGELPQAMSIADLFALPDPPEWHSLSRECQYRKGFYHGLVEASHLISVLYRKGGYVRPQEIANILYDYAEKIMEWRNGAREESPLNTWSHPVLKWESWSDVKSAVHLRDGNKCVECGSSDDLVAHHIVPVCDGGVPSIGNLVTLCARCHKNEHAKMTA